MKRKRIFSVFFLLATAFILSGCASTKIDSKKFELKEAVNAAASEIGKSVDGIVQVVAVVDIQSESEKLSAYVDSEFTHTLAKILKRAALVERDEKELGFIRKELKYQYSGEVSDDSVQSVARALGADCLILGTIKETSAGYNLVMKAIHVETRKILTSWSGIVDKSDKEIAFQSVKNLKAQKLKAEKRTAVKGAKGRLIMTAYNTPITSEDIADELLKELTALYDVIWCEYKVFEKKKQQNYAWSLYENNSSYYNKEFQSVSKKSYTLYTNNGCLTCYLFDYTTDVDYDWIFNCSIKIRDFLEESFSWLVRWGKSYTRDDLKAMNKIFRTFESTDFHPFARNLFSNGDFEIIRFALNLEKDDALKMCLSNGFEKTEDAEYNGYRYLLIDICNWNIHFTTRSDISRYIRRLVKLGLDVNVKGANWGANSITPLMAASVQPYAEADQVIRTLIETGAEINPSLGEISALGAAALSRMGYFYKVPPLTEKEKDQILQNIKTLIDYGAKLTSFENSLVPISAYMNDFELTKLLVASGANINAKDSEGKTALSYALEKKYTELTDFLRKNGAK